MRFCVNVPVLSQQITVVQPRVSTDGKLFTSAWRLAMRCTPMARDKVTVGNNPSGTLATKRPMQKTRASKKVRPATSQPRNRNTKPNPPASASDGVNGDPQLLLQRALFGGDFLGQIGDLADLGIHGGAENDGARPAAYQRRAGEKDIRQLDPEKFTGNQYRLIGFVAARRGRFTGERSVVDLDFERFGETTVSGN